MHRCPPPPHLRPGIPLFTCHIVVRICRQGFSPVAHQTLTVPYEFCIRKETFYSERWIPRPVNINESSLLIKPFIPADPNLLFLNSVDPDETAHNEPSHQDLHCLAFYLMFWLRPLFETMILTRFKDGRDRFRNSGVKWLTLLFAHDN